MDRQGAFIAPSSLQDSRVAMTKVPSRYDGADASLDDALLRLGAMLGWATDAGGAFARLVQPGDRVLVKPNWVLHRNLGKGGFDPLVTHGRLLRAMIGALRSTGAGRITIGDAPVQGCDFDALIRASDFGPWMAATKAQDDRVHGPVDFRRTLSVTDGTVRQSKENVRSLDEYVLFDLGADSYLEPVTAAGGKFRVTMYPPALMSRTHAPGRHQYLVAREVMEANVIVNAPKLKTHKKAGVTCALKNLVGINGNKEYLPHHRIGSPASGGDCYPEESAVKRMLEQVLDVQNTVRASAAQTALGAVARVLQSIAHRQGDQVGVEGAWSGNDTVWRMCLDLNRIVLYGRADGTIASEPQRQVVSVVDAIVAGQGDGPLAPDPLEMGVLFAGASSAAIDWVGSLLLGYDPMLIPITRGAFLPNVWPLVRFDADAIEVIDDGAGTPVAEMTSPVSPREITFPAGWHDAVQTGGAAAAR